MQDVDPLFLAFQTALVGRYSLERELGRGGMGVVYLAREVRLDRPVAIKLLPPELAIEQRLRDRFMREARMAARLSHPYIVPIHSVDEVGGFVFYVMTYVDGETLAQRVASRGPVPPSEMTRILREVAWALAYAHAQGVVHRDIKPANILLERGTGRAMVMDFGIARLTQATGETVVGELLGTPDYMSPEQATGEPLDGRSDLYSLGVTAFYALTGTLPFTASNAHAVLAQHLTKAPPSLAAVARGVPRQLAQVVDRCLQKDPAARYQTGEAMADALAPAMDARTEVPVPVRVFVDRRRMLLAVMPPVVLLPAAITDVTRILVRHGAAVSSAVPAIVLPLVAIVIPVTIILVRLRKLVRLGYGPDDIVAALRVSFARRREEFHFEHGAERGRSERVARAIAMGGFSLSAISVLPIAMGWNRPLAIGVGAIGLYFGALATLFFSKWRRLRENKGSMWMSFWQGPKGRAVARIAAFKLGQRAVPADRPTEVAIAVSAQELYASFPKELQRSIGDVPAVVRDLETRARALRARIESIDAAVLGANDHTGRATSGARQSLVADLGEGRAHAEQGLADVVTVLENLRLDLLRLRAGVGSPEGITHDLAAARELGVEVDRLVIGQREVDAAARTPA